MPEAPSTHRTAAPGGRGYDAAAARRRAGLTEFMTRESANWGALVKERKITGE